MPDHPLIGLTTYEEPVRHGIWSEDAAFTPVTYIDALRRSGGIPILLPYAADPGAATRALSAVDALVIIGGPDVDPALYGQERHPLTEDPRPQRDQWEMELARSAAGNRPLLAICRGVQLLNVALGGTLHQHLGEDTGHLKVEGEMSAVRISTETGSRINRIVGDEAIGLCHHHQAIDRLAAGLTATARAGDGVIEAVESTDGRWVLGVQWHPEENPADDRLFAALVAAAIDTY